MLDKPINRSPVRTGIAIVWIMVWIGAIGVAALIHFAFLNVWPDHFIHEDSGPYLDEARSILTGHYVDDAGRRPYGVAFFLVLLSKLFSPNILVFVAAQHVISIVSAILIAATVRMAGAPRIFALLAFLFAALYARTVHYDNTIGAETISVFLMCLPAFIAAGAVIRNWPPFLAAAGIGLSLGAAMVCRSAAVGAVFVILLWLAIWLDVRWIRRLGVLATVGAIAAMVYLVPAIINWRTGKQPAGNESLAVMEFIVGYSGDFDHGVHLDRKAMARQYVNQERAADGPTGWKDILEYQWPFHAVDLMVKPGESYKDMDAFVRDIFIETLTTPSTFWRHISRHFAREMYFLLFDANSAAQRASNPQAYEFFVERDPFPVFRSPTGIKPRTLVYDYYSPPKAMSWLLPSAQRAQLILDRLLSRGYMPQSDPVPICCRVTISSEYDDWPGPIRWLSVATLILLVLLAAGLIAGWAGWLASPPRNLVAVGSLMIILALVNAAFPTFLVYGFNRYAYYVTPFLAGATGILGAVLFDWMRLAVTRRRDDPATAVHRQEPGENLAMEA